MSIQIKMVEKIIDKPNGNASFIVCFQKVKSISSFRGDHAKGGWDNFHLKMAKLYTKTTMLAKK
ncbi:hypothetical protein ES703_85264 [subsurface metagenome]